VTALRYATDSNGLHHLVIEPTRGSFQGQLPARSYELHIHAADKPASISVDGKALGPGPGMRAGNGGRSAAKASHPGPDRGGVALRFRAGSSRISRVRP